MAIEFEITVVIPAAPETVYTAWLDSASHTAMTGGMLSHVSAEPGATFDACDNYIAGRNLELEEGRRIVQAWRTHEFTKDDPDSRLELRFDPHPEGTLLTLRHTGLPEDGMKYKQGWVEAYLDPMKEWFASSK
ncbi:MAG: hypothetical protein EPO32_09455 [Anaerolineae bacterium]|nr:MAG: hypothetical protein EPO32_09455 [Anaerolineae bacterium]